MSNFKTKQVHTSGLGTAEPYAYLNKPDYGNPELGFGNPRGVYRVNLTLKEDDPKCQEMVNEIVSCHEEHYNAAKAEFEKAAASAPRGKRLMQPKEGDMPFIDNGDGTITFKFKSYASYVDRKTNENRQLALVVVDSKGKRIKDVPIVGAGSLLKIKYSMFPYKWNGTIGASVKLQLEAVMIVKLVEFGTTEVSGDWGEEEVEGGFTAEDVESTTGGYAEEEASDGDY